MDKIEIYSSKKKLFLLLIASLLFVVVGIFMLLYFENIKKIIGLISILFFGLGIYFSIRGLVKNQLILVIDAIGINVNPKKSLSEKIEWKNIIGFSEIRIQGAKIVIIKVNNPNYWIEKEENQIRKKIMSFNTDNYGSPFNISANAMQISHLELIQILNDNFKKYKNIDC